MTWTLSSSLDDFRAQAGEFLAAHPAENTVLLTVIERLGADGLRAFGDVPPRFGWWRPGPGAPVEGAYVQTPPYNPRLGRMPAAAGAALAGALAEAGADHRGGEDLAGVSGNKAAVQAFSAAWRAVTGRSAALRVDERLYRLGSLAAPDPAPAGLARPAEAAERELLISWFGAFAAEVGVDFHNSEGAVDRRIADGTLHVWEVAGRAAAFAGRSPVIAGMSRIGPVFTPPELRGCGYASAATAAASARALALGAQEVLLYTDLANPTSNSIYRKLGYEPVEDCLSLDFHD